MLTMPTGMRRSEARLTKRKPDQTDQQFVYATRKKAIGPFKTRYGWGTAASPVLHKDRLYIVNDNDEQSFLAAFDTRTGAEVWRVNRAEGTGTLLGNGLLLGAVVVLVAAGIFVAAKRGDLWSGGAVAQAPRRTF